jgi:hypothetical protein
MINDAKKEQKFMPQKPHGEITLPSGKKVKVGLSAVQITRGKGSPLELLKKLKQAAREEIFSPPISKMQSL